jgi:tryptophanyl-tRNA synthetase
VTGKGILNRAHAYKASVDKNTHAGLEPDADVTAGLFMYPVLMGADILMFNAHHVPVGRDQIQHIEMARDMAHSFNHRYGEHFVPPLAAIEESVATLPGLDGRKMSKSYDNTIPLFAPREQLKKLIAGIKTDSLAPGVAKDTEGSALFQIYQAFASSEETATMAKLFAQGIGWGEAKEKLFERIDQEIAPMRERYQFLMDNPKEVQSILQLGAIKARSVATPFMATLRQAVGLRNLASETQTGVKKSTKTSGAVFKQYREKDGLFYFKFVDAKGELLIQSPGFESPKLAGLAIAQLKAEGINALGSPMDTLNASPERIEAALQSLREED